MHVCACVCVHVYVCVCMCVWYICVLCVYPTALQRESSSRVLTTLVDQVPLCFPQDTISELVPEDMR